HGGPPGGGAVFGDQALGEIPVGGRGDVGLAVAFVAHRAGIAGVGAGQPVAVDAGVALDVGRLCGGVAAGAGRGGEGRHAGAGGVAVGARHAGPEVLADAGVLGLEEGEGVAHRFAGGGFGGGAAGLAVHAVAPLVEEDRGDFAGVRAAAAGTVEV